MRNVSKDQALALAREHIWGWKPGAFDDCGDTPEESRRFAEWVLKYYERSYPVQIGKPLEVPCGWFIPVRSQNRMIGGPASLLTNLWTAEVVALADLDSSTGGFGLPSVEAYIRWYMETLPKEQRNAASSRMDYLPFAPIRFHPPCLLLDSAADDSSSKVRRDFSVEYDAAYFAARAIPLPRLTMREFYAEADGERGFYTVSRPEALTRLTEQALAGKVTHVYRLTVPPSLPGYGHRYASYQVELAVTAEQKLGEEADGEGLPLDVYRLVVSPRL